MDPAKLNVVSKAPLAKMTSASNFVCYGNDRELPPLADQYRTDEIGLLTRLSFAAALMLAGCGSGTGSVDAAGGDTSDKSPVTGSSRQANPPKICASQTDEPPPAAAAIVALGGEEEKVQFTLAEPLPEFRVRLLNHFQQPRDAATRIEERTWWEGDCRLTIWFAAREGGWAPVDWLRWDKGDEF